MIMIPEAEVFKQPDGFLGNCSTLRIEKEMPEL